MKSLAQFQLISKLALRNLSRSMGRNFATGSAVAAGFIAFLLASGYAIRVHNVLSHYTIFGLRTGHVMIVKKDALDHLAVKPAVWSLSPEDQEKLGRAIESFPNLVKFGPMLRGQGIASNGCKTFPFLATGVNLTVEEFALNHPSLLKWAPHLSNSRVGKPIWEYTPEDAPIAISQGLARLLGKTKVKDAFSEQPELNILDCEDPLVSQHFGDDANIQLAAGTWDGQLNAIDGEVVQTFSTGLSETNNSTVVLELKRAQSLFATENVSSLSVWLESDSFVDSFTKYLGDALGKDASQYEFVAWNDERVGPYYVGSMRFIITMVSFIGAVLAAVIILSIFNSATMTVIERSEEVGMLRSLGFRQGLIKLIFAVEGLYLTAMGSAVGLVVGILLMKFINSLEIHFNPPGVEGGLLLVFVPSVVVSAVAAVSVCSLGVFATYLAVSSVAKRNISELVAGSHR